MKRQHKKMSLPSCSRVGSKRDFLGSLYAINIISRAPRKVNILRAPKPFGGLVLGINKRSM